MGSFFAGIKAGTMGGILYVGGMAAFNVLLLYVLQAEVLASINRADPTLCPVVPNVNGSAQDCFVSLVTIDVPFVAFVAFFITLLYSGLFGIYHDYFPKISTAAKAMAVAAVVAVNLLFFGFGGYIFDSESAVATTVFLIVWTAVFGYSLGRLYRRYTRRVEFESEDTSMLKVLVDGRDVTGRSRTFAATSSHRVRAELSNDASFREWEGTGGVNLEDPRSFETVMEVNEDGTLRGKVSSKY
ncbi:MAG: hypothetical protein JRN06_00955 [Nitrososphaerota archaeon]|nr:hypothetical protein [Nitrososphaerota archaeon]MDG7023578.1 hypothetical protein [Nitrososphaerota archaeon]